MTGRRLLGTYLKPFAKPIALGGFFKLAEALLELLVPLLIADLIDRGVVGRQEPVIWQRLWLAFAIAAVSLIFAYICQYSASVAQQGLGDRLRTDLTAHVLQMDSRAAASFGSAALSNRLTADVDALQQALGWTIRLTTRAPFLAVGSAVMAFTIDPALALIFVAGLILFGLALYLIISRSLPVHQTVSRTLDRLIGVLLTNWHGARVIRAYGLSGARADAYAAENEAVLKQTVRAGRISSLMNPLTVLILNVSVVLVLYFGRFGYQAGRLSIGQIVALTNYLAGMLAALAVVASLVIQYSRAIASGRRVKEILHAPRRPRLAAEPLNPAGDAASYLSVENIRFAYKEGGKPLFDGLSFRLTDESTVGIVGQTGAGKSTLAYLLERQLRPTDGQIVLFGHALDDYPETELLRLLHVVEQRSRLLTMTLRENLVLGTEDVTDDSIWHALDVAQAASFVRKMPLGLDTPIEGGGRNLSGGQRQRLTIARGLIRRPRLLILDDAAAALDYRTESDLRLALARDPDYRGMKRVIISQRLVSVQHADRILLFDDGRLAGDGNHAELLRQSPLYRDLWNSQARLER